LACATTVPSGSRPRFLAKSSPESTRAPAPSVTPGAAEAPAKQNGAHRKGAAQSAAANGAEAGLSPDEARRRAALSKQMSTAFGQIVSVLMRTKPFRGLTLTDVEAMVVPAVNTGQFMIAEAQSKTNGFTSPVAALLWATVSADVDRRLSEKLDQPVNLEPKDWRSGDIPWLVTAAGDQRAVEAMLKQLQDNALKGRPLKTRAKQPDGTFVVTTVGQK
jgi:hemolysin-activating ACP:hemolysin acyltransferase